MRFRFLGIGVRLCNRKASVHIAAILLVLMIAAFELFIHLTPLEGATKEDISDYSTYPVVYIPLNHLDTRTESNDNNTYRVIWDEGNFFQTVIIDISADPNASQLSAHQINAHCSSLFFKQVGVSVNVVQDVIYVQISGYRRTLFSKGRGEQFGFAVSIADG